MKYRINQENYNDYVEAQNKVAKYNGQHSMKYDYEKMLDGLDSKSNLLDIGCRGGEIVKHWQEMGFAGSFGMDIGSSAIVKCNKKYGAEWTKAHIALGDAQTENLFKLKYDFINLSHTLEHFQDPDQAMKNITSMMNSGAKIFVVIPSDYYDYGDRVLTDPKCCPYHNIFWESEDDIKTFLEKFNLTVHSVSHNYDKGSKVGEWRLFAQLA